MSKNFNFIVLNVTNNVYVKNYNGALLETPSIFEAQRFSSFDEADNVAFSLNDDDCQYKAIELVW